MSEARKINRCARCPRAVQSSPKSILVALCWIATDRNTVHAHTCREKLVCCRCSLNSDVLLAPCILIFAEVVCTITYSIFLKYVTFVMLCTGKNCKTKPSSQIGTLDSQE